jgi:hypothetical protein
VCCVKVGKNTFWLNEFETNFCFSPKSLYLSCEELLGSSLISAEREREREREIERERRERELEREKEREIERERARELEREKEWGNIVAFKSSTLSHPPSCFAQCSLKESHLC